MPRSCSVCVHEARPTIDHALAAGRPYREIAGRFAVSSSALDRHKGAHLAPAVQQAQQTAEAAHALDIVQQLLLINEASLAILHEARETNQPLVALKAVEAVRRQLELQAKLLGELDERPQVNVLVSSDWARVRSALLDVLRPYPDAAMAVAERLLLLEGPQG